MKQQSIKRIATDRPTLYAFEVTGKISQPDIAAMAETLQAAFPALGTVDALILIRDWDGIELDAVFNAKAISTQARANKHIRKYAVVGAPGWARLMINLFAPLTPVEEKSFDLEAAQQAWAWVSE